MTDTDYWGKGYARILMKKIMQEYEGRTDGMFLYANDSVCIANIYPMNYAEMTGLLCRVVTDI